LLFRRTWDRMLGGIVSLFAAAFLLFFGLFFRREPAAETRLLQDSVR